MRPFDLWRWRQFWGRDWRGRCWTLRELVTGQRRPYITFTTDPACPCHCVCCPWETFRDTSRNLGMERMSWDQFKLYLSAVPRSVLIDFSGFGESLTNPAAPAMIEWAGRDGYMVQLYSTLAGLTPDGAKRLARVKLEKFVVHVPDAINYVTDEDKWLAQLRLLDGLPFPTLIFGTLGPVSDILRAEIAKRGTLLDAHFTDKKPLDKRGMLWRGGPLRCAFAGKRLDQWAVWPNGDVSVCFFDYRHESVIGNLAHENYGQIKDGARLAAYRRKMLSPSDECLCRHCNESKSADSPQ